MINKTELCIFRKKYIKHKLVFLISAALLFIAAPMAMFAAASGENSALQPITVSGIVVDEAGTPLPGVYVVVEGTNKGVITSTDGKFSIEISNSNSNLVFSYVGYVSQTINTEGRSEINVTMTEDFTALEEVVVIGYGTQRKEAVTGSVATVKEGTVKEIPASNITSALQGRISGVEMSQVSSKPGAAMQVRIRGTRSINATNDPLVVLDGIPFGGSLSDIDPNIIKSVDILKDASATAIYGSRGANGVILLTTNKGIKGQKAMVSYNGYYGMKKVFAPFPMMDGPQLAALRAARGQYSNGPDEFDDVNTDWQDLFYRNGSVNSHNLGISGGSEQGSYNFGIGYYNEQAVIPTQGYKRLNMRAAFDQQIGKNFTFGLSSTNNYSVNTGNQVNLYGILQMSPLVDPYNDDGSFKRTVRMANDDVFVWTKSVLNDLDEEYLSESRTYQTINSIYGEVKIPGVEGLKYRLNAGLSYRQVNDGEYTGRGVGAYNAETESTASINNVHNTRWVVENILSYDRTFNQKHQVNLVALYSAEQSKFNRSNVLARDIPTDDFQFYNLGYARGEITIRTTKDPQGYPYQDYQLRGLLSWMGRAMYSYDNRYMVSVALRSDGSSVLAEGHKWHTYPAVSAGWNIANESFMQDVAPVSALKLRVGYGQTSNQAIDPYKTYGLLGTRDYNFGSAYGTGYLVNELPNPVLGWEFSETWNYGLDFGLLYDRISGTVEYYTTTTKDLLLPLSLPATNGVTTIMSNIGEMQNKGVEVSLDGTILKDFNGFTWSVGLNFYTNKNKITKLATGETRNEANWWFVGQPLNVIFDYKKIGLWQEDDPYLANLEGSAGRVGMIKVLYTGDYNEDGTPVRQIGNADRQIINADPKFQGGFNTRLAYKGFDLVLVGSFKHGGVLVSTLHSSSGYLNLMTGRRGNVDVDYWTPENTGAKYPDPAGPLAGDNPKYGSTLGYFDAGYMKIRTITLGYTLGGNLLEKAGIRSMRIYATAQNPFVFFSPFKDETGMDPETNSYGDENAATTTTYPRRVLTIGTNTPSTRNYLIGINLTF